MDEYGYCIENIIFFHILTSEDYNYSDFIFWHELCIKA